MVKELMAAPDVPAQPAAMPTAPTMPEPEPPMPSAPARDPLIEIDGIGPMTQERLYAGGIETFAQLAGTDPELLRMLVGPAVTRRYNVEDWIEEARQRRNS
jgi:predicted flap endonuclease-1-like 5' DNA nuclease